MTAQHTPAPWDSPGQRYIIENAIEGGGKRTRWYEVDARKTPSGMRGIHTVALVKNIADVPLVAAAPDMLAALEFIVDQVSRPANADHTLGAWIHGAGFHMAVDALRKAKGETK
jgi:hypothetical protein